MSFVVKRAVRKDIPACIALNKASMPETYEPRFWTYIFNQFGDMFYVAKVEDKVVGYILCKADRQSSIPVGLIISVAVDREYRGQGIGERLMKDAHQAMKWRGIPMACLQVRVDNSAVKFYKKLDYMINMVIPNYYTNPIEDGYLMSLVF